MENSEQFVESMVESCEDEVRMLGLMYSALEDEEGAKAAIILKDIVGLADIRAKQYKELLSALMVPR